MNNVINTTKEISLNLVFDGDKIVASIINSFYTIQNCTRSYNGFIKSYK
jgi:hypothetical protein